MAQGAASLRTAPGVRSCEKLCPALRSVASESERVSLSGHAPNTRGQDCSAGCCATDSISVLNIPRDEGAVCLSTPFKDNRCIRPLLRAPMETIL
jgi:hypothetical protein